MTPEFDYWLRKFHDLGWLTDIGSRGCKGEGMKLTQVAPGVFAAYVRLVRGDGSAYWGYIGTFDLEGRSHGPAVNTHQGNDHEDDGA